MLKLLNKKYLTGFLTLLTLSTTNFLAGEECCCPKQVDDCCYATAPCNRFYIGAFGGQIFLNPTKFIQTGVAFFSEVTSIGPLAVDAKGHSKKSSPGFAGVQIGYEWKPNAGCCSNSSFAPAFEFEALFYRRTHKAHLINITDNLPEHDFLVTFPTKVGIYLASGVLAWNNCCFSYFTPYVGAGIGAANIHIRKADSLQVDPPEPGVNHFNSDRNDSAWAFAAQAKVGLRCRIFERCHLFAEYRYIYVDSSRYKFGATILPEHVPTTTWDVEMKRLYHNAYVIGLQFDL